MSPQSFPSWRHSLLLGFVALLTVASAQTYTNCNPTQKKCPPDAALPVSSYSYDFRAGPDQKHWTGSNGPITYTPLGAALTIAKEGDSPTLTSNWYFFFGRAEVRMRAAPGTGVVSCIVLESDDLDEIDWEWLGGEPYDVQTNYFGKGNTTTYDRGGKSPVFDSQGVTHVYAIDWSPSTVVWSIDGLPVRTLAYPDAVGGKNYPQTPMRLKMGVWAGGDPKNANGTIEWAGGLTNYTQGPFTMYLESVSVINTHPAGSYVYSDMSGSWQSISVSSVPAPAPLPDKVVAGAEKRLEADEASASASHVEAAEPTRSIAPKEKEDEDEVAESPVPTKHTTGVASSSSRPYATDNYHPDHAVDSPTAATTFIRGTPTGIPPPNITSAGNSLVQNDVIVWGVVLVAVMFWEMI
ncbi:family 16 putative glycoside hydrolase [Cladorrhinum sp. PSN259]|nr:family 16 putative glycoside hydrolase [Cladorrhinum sp. PSN259]